MRKIYLVLIVVLFAFQIKAQFVYDEWDVIVPFSLTEKYKDVVKINEIQSLVLPAYNNDSLCRANNNGKSLTELGSTFAAGFCIDTVINFKENAQSFELKEGTLWIYTIESPTAAALSAIVKDFDVEEGCYFSVIPGFMPYEINEPETYLHGEIPQRTVERGLERSVDNTKLVLELFEPNNVKYERNYTINKICYRYAGGFGQALKKHMEEIRDTVNFKSGFYGSSAYSGCQKDVVCTDIGNYQNEAKSVVFLRAEFPINKDDNGYYDRHIIISMSI